MDHCILFLEKKILFTMSDCKFNLKNKSNLKNKQKIKTKIKNKHKSYT